MAASELGLHFFLGIWSMTLGLQTNLTYFYYLLSKGSFSAECESSPKRQAKELALLSFGIFVVRMSNNFHLNETAILLCVSFASMLLPYILLYARGKASNGLIVKRK